MILSFVVFHQLNTSSHPFLWWLIEPVFGLFILGNRRNMVVQHGRICRRGLAYSADIKDTFYYNETQWFLVF